MNNHTCIIYTDSTTPLMHKENTMNFAGGVLRPSSTVPFSKEINDAPRVHRDISTRNSCLKITGSWRRRWYANSGHYFISGGFDIRDKWKEFQGIKNWEGLLDPLDDGLREEILRYGEFAEAAYRCFNFDTTSLRYASGLYTNESMMNQCGMETCGYKVTKSLNATCGIQLPHWTNQIPTWMSATCSWIGYVAVCDDDSEIARLGRRDVVVAYRGTATCMEWLENLRATLASLPPGMNSGDSDPMVQNGFLSLYTSNTTNNPSLQDSVRREIQRILHQYAGEPLSITVTGHSLGAALATLTAYDIATAVHNPPIVTVVSFGGPRVGNKSFRCQLEKTGTKVLRIVNTEDPITKVPGFVLDDNVGGGEAEWLRRRAEEARLAYAEIGEELRVSSRDCPHLNGCSVATCHDLKTYLHLVDTRSAIKVDRQLYQWFRRYSWFAKRSGVESTGRHAWAIDTWVSRRAQWARRIPW